MKTKEAHRPAQPTVLRIAPTWWFILTTNGPAPLLRRCYNCTMTSDIEVSYNFIIPKLNENFITKYLLKILVYWALVHTLQPTSLAKITVSTLCIKRTFARMISKWVQQSSRQETLKIKLFSESKNNKITWPLYQKLLLIPCDHLSNYVTSASADRHVSLTKLFSSFSGILTSNGSLSL